MNNERNHIEKINALSAGVIGFEFEFYSNLLKGKVAESLSMLLNKKVIVSEKYHSKIEIDRNNFKLEPDYSGGSKMMEFITGPLPYNEAIPILIKTLKWIDENGWTSDRCAFQYSISFDKFRPDIKQKMETLDKLKFILGFDENFIYSKFGNRSRNVYAKSIKRITPINRFSISNNINYIDPAMYKIPDDKYYGVNFTKAQLGYLEFRYLGNKDYQKKIKDIRDIIDYSLLYLYDMLSERTTVYTQNDLKKLQNILKKHNDVSRSFSSPETFFRKYPNFNIFIDLKGFDEIIKTYWTAIREKIFDLIIDANIKFCYFNYDTMNGRYQIKEAISRDAIKIEGFDIIMCDIKNGIIENCEIYDSEINKSAIENSVIKNNNIITSGKIKNTTIHFSNEINDCFIDCEGKNINGKINGGVIRSGNIGEMAEISNDTLKVKGFSYLRSKRFITDSRLSNLNSNYKKSKFKDRNV